MLLDCSLILSSVQSLSLICVLDRLLVVHRPCVDFVAALADSKAPSRNQLNRLIDALNPLCAQIYNWRTWVLHRVNHSEDLWPYIIFRLEYAASTKAAVCENQDAEWERADLVHASWEGHHLVWQEAANLIPQVDRLLGVCLSLSRSV